MVLRHSLKDIDEGLSDIASNLREDVSVFHIGGNAMCWYGLKETTKDSDLVLLSEDKARVLVDTLLDYGFHPQVPSEPGYDDCWGVYVYPSTFNINEDAEVKMRIDLFVQRVSGKLFFSEGMVSRSTEYKTLGKLSTKMCSKEDIFLFKSAASREGDKPDLISLVESGLDWDIVYDELKTQISLIEKSRLQWVKGLLMDSFDALAEENRGPPNKIIKLFDNI